MIQKIKCWFGFHNWAIVHEGSSHRNLLHLSQFADTIHICSECYVVRNYLHTSGDKLEELARRGII